MIAYEHFFLVESSILSFNFVFYVIFWGNSHDFCTSGFILNSGGNVWLWKHSYWWHSIWGAWWCVVDFGSKCIGSHINIIFIPFLKNEHQIYISNRWNVWLECYYNFLDERILIFSWGYLWWSMKMKSEWLRVP